MRKLIQIAVLISILLSGCSSSRDEIICTNIEKKNFEITIPSFGSLKAVKSTPVKVPINVRGRLTIIFLKAENSSVNKGDVVAGFDKTTYLENIKREQFKIAKLNLEILKKENDLKKEKKGIKSDIEKVKIEKEIADNYGKRDESIFSKNEIVETKINDEYLKVKSSHYVQKESKQEKKAEAELQLLKLKKKTVTVKMQQYQDTLNSLELKAPHDGLFVYKKNWRGEKPRVGKSAYRGMEIGRLPDLTKMEGILYVLESEAAGLKENLSVKVTLDSVPGRFFKGKIKSIAAIAKPVKRDDHLKYFEIKVSLEKTDQELMKPGVGVHGKIYVAELKGVISVPNQAIFKKEGKSFVYIKSGGGFEAREVKTGIRSITKTVIEEGLKEGDSLILNLPEGKG